MTNPIQLTAAIEIVARAKGSPMIFPIWMPLRPYCLDSILSDGECSEPYEGMNRQSGQTSTADDAITAAVDPMFLLILYE